MRVPLKPHTLPSWGISVPMVPLSLGVKSLAFAAAGNLKRLSSFFHVGMQGLSCHGVRTF